MIGGNVDSCVGCSSMVKLLFETWTKPDGVVQTPSLGAMVPKLRPATYISKALVSEIPTAPISVKYTSM